MVYSSELLTLPKNFVNRRKKKPFRVNFHTLKFTQSATRSGSRDEDFALQSLASNLICIQSTAAKHFLASYSLLSILEHSKLWRFPRRVRPIRGFHQLEDSVLFVKNEHSQHALVTYTADKLPALTPDYQEFATSTKNFELNTDSDKARDLSCALLSYLTKHI